VLTPLVWWNGVRTKWWVDTGMQDDDVTTVAAAAAAADDDTTCI